MLIKVVLQTTCLLLMFTMTSWEKTEFGSRDYYLNVVRRHGSVFYVPVRAAIYVFRPMDTIHVTDMEFVYTAMEAGVTLALTFPVVGLQVYWDYMKLHPSNGTDFDWAELVVIPVLHVTFPLMAAVVFAVNAKRRSGQIRNAMAVCAIFTCNEAFVRLLIACWKITQGYTEFAVYEIGLSFLYSLIIPFVWALLPTECPNWIVKLAALCQRRGSRKTSPEPEFFDLTTGQWSARQDENPIDIETALAGPVVSSGNAGSDCPRPLPKITLVAMSPFPPTSPPSDPVMDIRLVSTSNQPTAQSTPEAEATRLAPAVSFPMISHPHVPRSSTSAQNLISGSVDFIFQGHLPSAVRIAQLLRENQLLFSQRPALPLRQTSGKSNPDLRRQGVSLESPGSSVSEDLISNFGLKSCTPYQGINRQIYGMPPNPMSEATKRFTNSVADQRPLEEELILNPPKSVPSSSYAPPPDYVHNYEI